MRRNMNLIRQILLQTEAAPFGPSVEIKVEGFSDEEIAYHIMILDEGGYIKSVISHGSKPNNKTVRLTWAGHEFVEAAKDDTRWNNALTYLKERGGPMMFDVLKSVLLTLVNQQVFGK